MSWFLIPVPINHPQSGTIHCTIRSWAGHSAGCRGELIRDDKIWSNQRHKLCPVVYVGVLHYLLGGAHISFCWKLILIFYTNLLFDKLKVLVFFSIVFFHPSVPYFKLNYFNVLKRMLYSCLLYTTAFPSSKLYKILWLGSVISRENASDLILLPFELICLWIFTRVWLLSPAGFMWFMGDWEWDSFQCDLCGAGFDQTTVRQPEATETVGMMQPAEEENFNPTQTAAATEK